MSGRLDYSKLTNDQLLKLKAVDGDLTKLSDGDLQDLHSTLNPSLGDRALSVAKDIGSAVSDFGHRAGEYRDSMLLRSVGGVAGLPRMAGDAYNWLERKAGMAPELVDGKSPLDGILPTGEEATNWLLGVAKNAPTAPGQAPWQERTINPIVDAGVQAMFSPLRAGGAIGPAINFASGAGGEIAGEVAHDYLPDFETPARLFGSVLGAGTGAGLARTAQKAGRAVAGTVAPFTAGGRQTIVGRALNDLADDPARAMANMDSYVAGQDAFPTLTPGFRLTASKAARDDALMATENAMNVPGSGFGMRVRQNNEALTNALGALDSGMDPRQFVAELAKQDAGAAMRAQAALDALPPGADAATAGAAIQNALRGRYDALKTARSDATEPLYQAAREDTTRMKPFPLLASTADAVAANKGELRATAQKVRGLLFDANGKADRSVPGMMATRDAINDMLDSASPAQKRMLLGFRDEVDQALSAVPAEMQARSTFADMSRPLDAFSADKGNPFAANVVEKDRYGTNFMLPAERVPTQFFKPGDAGGATMKEFLATKPSDDAVSGMVSYISDQARSAGDLNAFLTKFSPAIDTLGPRFRNYIEQAAATGSISEGFRTSPAGKFLDGDLGKAVRSTLNAPDATKRMQSLRMSVGGNPDAVQGLQKAVLDDYRSRVLARTGEDGAGNAMLVPNQAESWLRANRGAVANVLSPDQIAGLEAINRALKDQAQTAVKVAGSDTSKNLATRSIIDALLWKGAGDATWLNPLQKTIGLAAGGADAKAVQLLTDALLDPRLASALMKKATPQNVRLSQPLFARLLTASAGSFNQREEKGGR